MHLLHGLPGITDPVMLFVVRSSGIIDPARIFVAEEHRDAFCCGMHPDPRSYVQFCRGIQRNRRSFPGIRQHVWLRRWGGTTPLYPSWRKCDPFIPSLCLLAGVSPRRFDWMGGRASSGEHCVPIESELLYLVYPAKVNFENNQNLENVGKWFHDLSRQKQIWGTPLPRFLTSGNVSLIPQSRLWRQW